MLPCNACCVLSRLRCNGHSLLLSSYLFRIGRIENPSCSACGHSSQDTSHLILHCPATDSLRRSLFGDSLSFYNFWFGPGVLRDFWGSMVFCHAPSLRRGQVARTTTVNSTIVHLFMAKQKQVFAYNEDHLKLELTSMELNGEVRPQRVFCLKLLAHSSLKEAKLHWHQESNHEKCVDKTLEAFKEKEHQVE